MWLLVIIAVTWLAAAELWVGREPMGAVGQGLASSKSSCRATLVDAGKLTQEGPALRHEEDDMAVGGHGDTAGGAGSANGGAVLRLACKLWPPYPLNVWARVCLEFGADICLGLTSGSCQHVGGI